MPKPQYASWSNLKTWPEKEYTYNPRKLARVFVSAKEKNLNHVNQDDGDHEIRAPSVERADVPAERDTVIQRLQAVPCLSGGRHVDQSEQDASDDLQDEDRESSAAKNIEPAGGLARNNMLGGLTDGGGELQALVEPFADG
jgi:hypothetical protein